MKNGWFQSEKELSHEYYVSDNLRYKISISVEDPIDYFIHLNDEFKNFKRFLKIENKKDLLSEIKVAKIQFDKISSFDEENVVEKLFFFKKIVLHSFPDEENFYCFELSPDGKGIEWGKCVNEQLEEYIALCKKQVELWEN